MLSEEKVFLSTFHQFFRRNFNPVYFSDDFRFGGTWFSCCRMATWELGPTEPDIIWKMHRVKVMVWVLVYGSYIQLAVWLYKFDYTWICIQLPHLLNEHTWYGQLWGPSQRVVTLFINNSFCTHTMKVVGADNEGWQNADQVAQKNRSHLSSL